jgi:hypothetical protein
VVACGADIRGTGCSIAPRPLDHRQYVEDEGGEKVFGVWVPPADEPAGVEVRTGL